MHLIPTLHLSWAPCYPWQAFLVSVLCTFIYTSIWSYRLIKLKSACSLYILHFNGMVIVNSVLACATTADKQQQTWPWLTAFWNVPGSSGQLSTLRQWNSEDSLATHQGTTMACWERIQLHRNKKVKPPDPQAGREEDQVVCNTVGLLQFRIGFEYSLSFK